MKFYVKFLIFSAFIFQLNAKPLDDANLEENNEFLFDPDLYDRLYQLLLEKNRLEESQQNEEGYDAYSNYERDFVNRLINDVDVNDDEDDEDEEEDDVNYIGAERRFLESLLLDKYRKSTTTTTTTRATSRSPSSGSSTDAFTTLKLKCEQNQFDSLCLKTKMELYELVKKCELSPKKTQKMRDTCNEVISTYCYVYSKMDKITCLLTPHDPYEPGKTKPTGAPASTTTTTTPRTTTTTTTRTTTRSSSSTTTTTRGSNRPVTTTSSSSSGGYPFNLIPGFTGTIKEIPSDTKALKEIGTYCAQTTSRDKNCDILLGLLKDQFKKCEKAPSNDGVCQSFKVKFCTAYPNFNCCGEVLQGKACLRKTSKRTMMLELINQYLRDEEFSQNN